VLTLAPAAHAQKGLEKVETKARRKGGDEARKRKNQRPEKRAEASKSELSSKQLTEIRRRQKFDRVKDFEPRLPELRDKVQTDLRRPGLGFPRAMAAIVRIMDTGFVRVGDHRYADPAVVDDKEQKLFTYGACSLRKDQVHTKGDRVYFDFVGKSRNGEVQWNFSLRDADLAAVVDDFKAQPSNGPELFQVRQPGGYMSVVSTARVRTLMRRYGGQPKDLRTHHANRIVRAQLESKRPGKSPKERRTQIDDAIAVAAKALNHKKETSRASYVEHEMIERFEKTGTLGPRGPP